MEIAIILFYSFRHTYQAGHLVVSQAVAALAILVWSSFSWFHGKVMILSGRSLCYHRYFPRQAVHSIIAADPPAHRFKVVSSITFFNRNTPRHDHHH
jgi:hypothetical protein